MKKVSVILPSYNVVDYIAQCLESVLNQNLFEIEILCIDAGSTDGTLDVIKEYQKRDPRIKVIHSEIKSYGYQVNLGIKISDAKYVAVLETDDYIDWRMYSELYDLAETYGLDYVKGEYTFLFSITENDVFSKDMSTLDTSIYNRVISISSEPSIILNDKNIWRGIYNTKFLKENAIKLNETKGAAFQDIGFVVQTVIKANRAMYVNDPFYKYRYNRPGCSTFSNNCLKNAYVECELLMKNCVKALTCEVRSQFFLRMQCIFIEEFNKIIEKWDYDINSEFIKKYYQGFAELFSMYERDYGMDLESQVRQCIYDVSGYLREKKRVFIEKRMHEEIMVEKAFSYDKVVVVGAGMQGCQLLELLFKRSIKVAFILDNYKNRTQICGIEVYSVQEVSNMDQDKYKYLYIISVKNESRTIRNQLTELGIETDRIFLFSEN